MGRPYPHRRRKRPGRRPPHRYRGAGRPIRPNSFQDFGLRHIYNLIIPGVRGPDRRKLFNQVSSGYVLGMGLTAAFIGFGVAGVPGAILGGIAASALMDHALKKHRFFRP